MPGQHRPGYDAAYKQAQRIAARLYRDKHPDQWKWILNQCQGGTPATTVYAHLGDDLAGGEG